MSKTELEKRVETLEAELARLKSKFDVIDAGKPWWERIAGSFEDDTAHADAMKLGNRYRRGLKPAALARTKRS